MTEKDFHCECCNASFSSSGYEVILDYMFGTPLALSVYCPVCQTRIIQWIRKDSSWR